MVLISAALASLLAAGCRGEEPADEEPEAINPNRVRIIDSLPMLPRVIVRDTTGTAESERRVYFTTSAGLDSVARFYRRSLAAAGWREVNFLGDSTVFDLTMRKDSLSLWVHGTPAPPPLVNATHFTILAAGTITPGTLPDTLPRRRGAPRPD